MTDPTPTNNDVPNMAGTTPDNGTQNADVVTAGITDNAASPGGNANATDPSSQPAINPANVVSPPDLLLNNTSVQKIEGVDSRLQEVEGAAVELPAREGNAAELDDQMTATIKHEMQDPSNQVHQYF